MFNASHIQCIAIWGSGGFIFQKQRKFECWRLVKNVLLLREWSFYATFTQNDIRVELYAPVVATGVFAGERWKDEQIEDDDAVTINVVTHAATIHWELIPYLKQSELIIFPELTWTRCQSRNWLLVVTVMYCRFKLQRDSECFVPGGWVDFVFGENARSRCGGEARFVWWAQGIATNVYYYRTVGVPWLQCRVWRNRWLGIALAASTRRSRAVTETCYGNSSRCSWPMRDH